MFDFGIWLGCLSPVIPRHNQRKAGDRRKQPQLALPRASACLSSLDAFTAHYSESAVLGHRPHLLAVTRARLS